MFGQDADQAKLRELAGESLVDDAVADAIPDRLAKRWGMGKSVHVVLGEHPMAIAKTCPRINSSIWYWMRSGQRESRMSLAIVSKSPSRSSASHSKITRALEVIR
ncbi:hypothetical protein [Roseimaritima multifibrata]|uniref:hypothetical protein n=1 Tax=Roseimaritima multifibrata TaxID=1930274 RepID=UPI001FEA5608|nr:hypothetical protein [Roseimaritima multifibrata]